MLSSLKEAESLPAPPPPEFKPSLTVYAHKIATQITEVRSLLTSSLAHIAEDRGALHKTIEDTRSLINGHELNNTKFGNITAAIGGTVNELKPAISSLEQSLASGDTNRTLLHDEIAALTNKMDTQDTLLRELVGDLKDMAEAQKDTLLVLGSILKQQQRLQNPPQPIAQPSETQNLPVAEDPLPPPAAADQEPVLSDIETENSIDVVNDTPTTAKKPGKAIGKPNQTQSEPSQSQKPPAPVNKGRVLRSAKRQRSISLGLVVEATPSQTSVQPSTRNPPRNQQLEPSVSESMIVEFSPDDMSVQSAQNTQVGSIDEDEIKSEENSERGFTFFSPVNEPAIREPVTPEPRSKKRILAGPATQEAWERDSSAS
ncbi:hypothetical protein H072_236 [Dactylellina haptotyla CBS 200.50]|uniref:Uncharacterized protein n=1 Tax=Dactylellina haptotyla (strain CBS 200.50) TaxID=1284197 RepID=S8C203_DACHA|nr:hypothetical protein H072_236 [Dactylellina haptotyla CBS 200.50]